jgi:hypothetical protein
MISLLNLKLFGKFKYGVLIKFSLKKKLKNLFQEFLKKSLQSRKLRLNWTSNFSQFWPFSNHFSAKNVFFLYQLKGKNNFRRMLQNLRYFVRQWRWNTRNSCQGYATTSCSKTGFDGKLWRRVYKNWLKSWNKINGTQSLIWSTFCMPIFKTLLESSQSVAFYLKLIDMLLSYLACIYLSSSIYAHFKRKTNYSMFVIWYCCCCCCCYISKIWIVVKTVK